MSQQGKFDCIIASLHEAMLDDSHWRETSVLIDDACGITGTHLVLIGDDANGDATWLFDRPYWRGELREDLGRDYAENYFSSDERIPRHMRMFDRGVVRVTDIYTDRELKTSPTFNELLRRAEVKLNVSRREVSTPIWGMTGISPESKIPRNGSTQGGNQHLLATNGRLMVCHTLTAS